jgi:hypothetical protein
MNERDASGEPAGISARRFVGRWDRVSQWLVHRAASAAPPALVARLEEEWLADLATRPSVFSRLRFALGCCWSGAAARCYERPDYRPRLLGPSLAYLGDLEVDFQTPTNIIRRSQNGTSNRGSRRFGFVWMRMGG